MSAKNPTEEIFFFMNTAKDSKLIYVYMSLQAGKEEFFEMFETTKEITQKQFDRLARMGGEVVFVGDDHIIDKYFSGVKTVIPVTRSQKN